MRGFKEHNRKTLGRHTRALDSLHTDYSQVTHTLSQIRYIAYGAEARAHERESERPVDMSAARGRSSSWQLRAMEPGAQPCAHSPPFASCSSRCCARFNARCDRQGRPRVACVLMCDPPMYMDDGDIHTVSTFTQHHASAEALRVTACTLCRRSSGRLPIGAELNQPPA